MATYEIDITKRLTRVVEVTVPNHISKDEVENWAVEHSQGRVTDLVAGQEVCVSAVSTIRDDEHDAEYEVAGFTLK
ncbi:MAG: hypothetical protein ACNI3A_18620 [Desulfovibrio sp.]|uniref:hypothetical protein n=1 Tax=Desulfovibrio sp. 7SRBS1 TaxID=3378064 RepID=UPI003B3E316F